MTRRPGATPAPRFTLRAVLPAAERRATPDVRGSVGLHQPGSGGAERDVLPPVTLVDDLVAVGRWGRDQGARLARFLLGHAVAGLGVGVARRGRQTRPTRSSDQKGQRAAAANEAAHLSKYKGPAASRHRDAAWVRTREKCIRVHGDIAPSRRRVVACCEPPDTMPWPHTNTPWTPFPSAGGDLDLPIGRVGHGTVRDCRSSANRRGLCAPMAKVS